MTALSNPLLLWIVSLFIDTNDTNERIQLLLGIKLSAESEFLFDLFHLPRIRTSSALASAGVGLLCASWWP